MITDTRRGETILGFYVRAGQWIDGIEILTSSGRRSGVFGNALGGSGYGKHSQISRNYANSLPDIHSWRPEAIMLQAFLAPVGNGSMGYN